MPIYQVTPLSGDAEPLAQAVQERIPAADRFELQASAGWLVFHTGTTVELSNQLGITGPTGRPENGIGPAMVTSIGSYYGLGAVPMWEWLKTRFERQT